MIEIKLLPDFFELAVSGRKGSTVRLGLKGEVGKSVLVNTETKEKYHVTVKWVERVDFEHLQEIHARKDGFQCLSDLKKALREIYGEIPKNQVMSIIHFQ